MKINKKGIIASSLVVLFFIFTWGYIKAEGEQITACIKKDGSLYVPMVGNGCKGQDNIISWNIRGPKGDKGDKGEQGPKGEDGKDFVLPDPKTVVFAENKTIISPNGSPDAEAYSDWQDLSGGYNQLAIIVEKSGGPDNAYLRAVSIEFSNNPLNPSETASQGRLICSQTSCPISIIPILAKYYRINFNVNTGMQLSSYGYLSNN